MPNPPPAPVPRAAILCLQLSFAAMCCGVGLHILAGEGPLFSLLFLQAGWSERAALAVSHGFAYALLAAAPLLLWRRAWPVLLAVGGWLAVLLVLDYHQHPVFYWLLPPSWAVRYAGPPALALLLAGAPGAGRCRLSVTLLRLAAAATFVGHGLEALALRGAFLDLIYGAGIRLFGHEPAPAVAETALRLIGVIDLLVAAGLLAPRRRLRLACAAYMAVWGMLTAASRTLHGGALLLPETLLRVPNGGVPLALWWLWRTRSDREGGSR